MPAQAGIQGFFKDGFRLEACRNDAIEFPFPFPPFTFIATGAHGGCPTTTF